MARSKSKKKITRHRIRARWKRRKERRKASAAER
jgi:hypothetical protein